MRFSILTLAAAGLAAAETITTTCTLTDKVTKTMTLSKVTVIATMSNNTTIGVSTTTASAGLPVTTAWSPSIVPPPNGKNAAGALDASKVAYAGLAGIVAMAML